ncbi:MAG: hypothetical protein Q4D23_08645 [Bacteroidales bacterium]|nr:hypothetical protein [Bacteroidales bacterium]
MLRRFRGIMVVDEVYIVRHQRPSPPRVEPLLTDEGLRIEDFAAELAELHNPNRKKH